MLIALAVNSGFRCPARLSRIYGCDERAERKARLLAAELSPGYTRGARIAYRRRTLFFSGVLSVHGTAWIWAAAVSFGIAVLGAALLFIAKLPLYRQKRFFTFGIRSLPESSHGYYRWGCRLSILGCVLMLLLWLGSTIWR